MILHHRPGTGADDASMAAVERAYLEWFCSARLFLPRPGLEAIAAALEAEGFCFLAYGQVLTMALFPYGWSLMPVSAEPLGRSLHAYLADPSGAIRARIFYRDSGYERRSHIAQHGPGKEACDEQ
jgi:hypothetical protein